MHTCVYLPTQNSQAYKKYFINIDWVIQFI